jgi:hypothetical protein
MDEPTECDTQKEGPDDDRDDPLPETQFEEADSEEPEGKPSASGEGMLLDMNLLHAGSIQVPNHPVHIGLLFDRH